MYLAIIILAALADIAFLLPQALKVFFLPELRGLWLALGQLIDALAVTGCWLLLYLLWEKRFAREVRDGVSFWTAVGAALARLLVCAASAAPWLRGEGTRTWTLLRLLWPLLIAALVLRLVSIGLDLPGSPILLRLPLIAVHVGIIVCLRKMKI